MSNIENFGMINQDRRKLMRSLQNKELNTHINIVTEQSIDNQIAAQTRQLKQMQQSQLQDQLKSQIQTELKMQIQSNPSMQSQPYLQSQLKNQLQSQLQDTLQSQQALQNWLDNKASMQSQQNIYMQSQIYNSQLTGCNKILYENDGFISTCTDLTNNFYNLTIDNVDGVFNNVKCDTTGDVTIYYNGAKNTITQCGDIKNPNIAPK